MERERAKKLLRALGEKADSHGIQALSEEERNVLVPYWARGLIGNGGFRYFFEHDHPLSDTVRRMRSLGLGSTADACESVLGQLFPGGAEPADYWERRRLTDGIDWDRFDPEESAIYKVSWDQFTDAIGAYIESHPDAFRSLE